MVYLISDTFTTDKMLLTSPGVQSLHPLDGYHGYIPLDEGGSLRAHLWLVTAAGKNRHISVQVRFRRQL